MAKLDINKPVMYRDRHDVLNVKYVMDYISTSRERVLVFLATSTSGGQFIAERLSDGRLSELCEQDDDIINVPEKPAFSWDKPAKTVGESFKLLEYRENEDIYDNKDYPIEALMEHIDKSRVWFKYTKNGRHCVTSKSRMDLENYEPEIKYEIESMLWTHNGWIKFILNENNEPIAGFETKKDAEAFKTLKEKGL